MARTNPGGFSIGFRRGWGDWQRDLLVRFAREHDFEFIDGAAEEKCEGAGMSKSAKKPSAAGTRLPSRADFDEVLALIESARARAISVANTTLIDLYWAIGEHITRKVADDGWGKGGHLLSKNTPNGAASNTILTILSSASLASWVIDLLPEPWTFLGGQECFRTKFLHDRHHHKLQSSKT
jgi:hypothetical protein